MPLPSVLSYVGIAKEATKGTGVVPTDFIPISQDIKPVDKVLYLDDNGLRGSMVDVYDQIAGPIFSELGMNGIMFPDTFGYILAAITGDVVTTGASAPYSHVMAVKNSTDGQPKAYTITDYYGAASARQYAGMQCSELTVNFSGDSMLTYSSKWTGYQSTQVAAPTRSYSPQASYASWRGAVTIAGVSKTFLMDGSLSLTRNVQAIHTVDNTQSPYAVFVGPLMVNGDVTFIHEDDTELTRYLTNTQPAVVLDFTQGAAASLTELKFQMTKCAYVEGAIDRGKDFVASTYKLRGVANATDVGATSGYSAVKATLQSNKAASTYV